MVAKKGEADKFSNTQYVSVSLPAHEKQAMDEAVARAGIPRNRWLRNLIARAVAGSLKD